MMMIFCEERQSSMQRFVGRKSVCASNVEAAYEAAYEAREDAVS